MELFKHTITPCYLFIGTVSTTPVWWLSCDSMLEPDLSSPSFSIPLDSLLFHSFTKAPTDIRHLGELNRLSLQTYKKSAVDITFRSHGLSYFLSSVVARPAAHVMPCKWQLFYRCLAKLWKSKPEVRRREFNSEIKIAEIKVLNGFSEAPGYSLSFLLFLPLLSTLLLFKSSDAPKSWQGKVPKACSPALHQSSLPPLLCRAAGSSLCSGKGKSNPGVHFLSRQIRLIPFAAYTIGLKARVYLLIIYSSSDPLIWLTLLIF